MLMTSSWSLVGVVAIALVNNVAAVPFNITLDSFACQLDYQPDSANGPIGSWNASFTQSPWAGRTEQRGGRTGLGIGYHYTTVLPNVTEPPPAWVGYTFYGTGVQFFGHWGNLGDGSVTNTTDQSGAVRMSLSGGPDKLDDITSSGNMTGTQVVSLGRFTNLALGNYTVRLIPTAGTVTFIRLIVEMELGASTWQEANQGEGNPSVYKPYVDGGDDSTIVPNSKFGAWKGPNGAGAGSWAGQQTNENKRVGSNALGDSIDIDLGVGNVFMRLNGTTSFNHGVFRIEINPTPPGFDGKREYWGFTPWQVLHSTLFATGLNPNEQYHMTLTNLQNDKVANAEWAWFDLTALTLWKVPTTATATGSMVVGSATGAASNGASSSKGSIPIGAIVGGVVGGVTSIAALIAAIFFWKKRAKKTQDVHPSSVMIDPESFMTTPFVVDHAEQGGGGVGPPQHDMMNQVSQFGHQQQMGRQPMYGVPPERQRSWSQASSGQPFSNDYNNAAYSDGSGGYAGGLASMAAGIMPGMVGHDRRSSAPAKLAPQQPAPVHHLATDAGPIDDATPMGEMPPTYDPSWVPTSGLAGSQSGRALPRLPPGAGPRSPLSSHSASIPVTGGWDNKAPR